MRKIFLIALLAASIPFLNSEVEGQVKTRVRFPPGTLGTTVRGTVRGFEYRDYVVGASAGQTMSVSLNASDSFTVFTIFDPGGDNLEGGTENNKFRGDLPASGDYVVRVLMMRSQARRRGSISNYTLKITVK